MPEYWRIRVDHDVIKVLGKLPRDLRERMRRAIDALSEDPRPVGCRKLRGHEDLFRVRVGDWRIIYTVRDADLEVLVIEVSARGNAYRDL